MPPPSLLMIFNSRTKGKQNVIAHLCKHFYVPFIQILFYIFWLLSLYSFLFCFSLRITCTWVKIAQFIPLIHVIFRALFVHYLQNRLNRNWRLWNRYILHEHMSKTELFISFQHINCDLCDNKWIIIRDLFSQL